MNEVAKRDMTAMVNPESLLAQAIEKGLPVETMERLLDMRRELKAEWAREQYFAALASFQAECPVIQKSKVVKDKSGKPRYHYAPLEVIVGQVKDLLNKHGFSYVLDPNQDEKSFTAVCVSHHVDGHSERTSFTVPIDSDSYMSAPQRVGSARTFAMRYAFCDAFGILTGDEDDDGHDENGNGDKKKTDAPPSPPPPAPGIPAEEIEFLKDDLLTYLDKSMGTLAEADVNILKANIEIVRQKLYDTNPKPVADVEYAKWLKNALNATVEEVKKQEALLAANAGGVHPAFGEAIAEVKNPMAAAVGKLEQAAKESGKVPTEAPKQGEMYDHE